MAYKWFWDQGFFGDIGLLQTPLEGFPKYNKKK